MKVLCRNAGRFAAAVAVALLANLGAAAQYLPNSIFVVQVSQINNTSEGAVSINSYSHSGGTWVAGPSVAVPSTGSAALTMSFTTEVEGALSVSPNGRYLGFAGYRTGTSGSGTQRVIARMDLTTSVVDTSTAMPSNEAYTSSNGMRSAVWNDAGNRYWASGQGNAATGGVRTNTLGSTSGSVRVSTGQDNMRWVGIFNGQLYATSGAGANLTRGLNAVGVGVPTNSGNALTLTADATPTGTESASPFGFALSPDGLILYMADDRNIANGGGIQKWTRENTSSTFTHLLTFGTGEASTHGARGLAVDFSGDNPVIYATTAENSANRLISFVDVGGIAMGFNVIDIAENGTIFRGVAFSPVPEPELILLLVAVGWGGFAAYRRLQARHASSVRIEPIC
jgi:hypothetical protein